MENVADFGLTQLPVIEKRVQVVEIYRDEVRAMVPAGHPLAAMDKVRCEDVIAWPLLLPQTGMTRSRLNAWFESVEDELQVSMELDSSETMKRFVMAGLGISFLAASNCLEEVEAGTLATIPLAPEPMIRKLGLIYRKDKALPKAALGFIQVILGQFGSPGSPAREPRLALQVIIESMTCPRCHSEFETPGDVCPECGVNLLRNVSGVMKTSAVHDCGRRRTRLLQLCQGRTRAAAGAIARNHFQREFRNNCDCRSRR